MIEPSPNFGGGFFGCLAVLKRTLVKIGNGCGEVSATDTSGPLEEMVRRGWAGRLYHQQASGFALERPGLRFGRMGEGRIWGMPREFEAGLSAKYSLFGVINGRLSRLCNLDRRSILFCAAIFFILLTTVSKSSKC